MVLTIMKFSCLSALCLSVVFCLSQQRGIADDNLKGRLCGITYVGLVTMTHRPVEQLAALT